MAAEATRDTGSSRHEAPKKHHHGNLRAALVEAGIGMLETEKPFSLRAVAREVGVSQTAPYRHFQDKDHLEAAMAAHGFATLQASMENVVDEKGQDRTGPADLAVVYVHYAAEHPALYRLMYAPAADGADERVIRSREVFQLLERMAQARYPQRDPHGLASAGWALAHGLASLYLDGKLVGTDRSNLDQRVRAAFSAILPDSDSE